MQDDPRDHFKNLEEMIKNLIERSLEQTGSKPVAYGFKIIITGAGTPGVPPEILTPSRNASEPVAEVYRIGNEVKVTVELPGVSSEEINLSFEGSTLIIKAESENKKYKTSAELPPVDQTNISGSFRNGLLEVTFNSLEEKEVTDNINQA